MKFIPFIVGLSLFFQPVKSNGNEKKKDAGYNYKNSLSWITDKCNEKHACTSKTETKECVKWSTGLEHESFLVHRKEGSMVEHVINSGTVALQMYRYGRAFGLSKEQHSVAVYLERTGVEFSGRACANINDINFKAMAESVTTSHMHVTYDEGYCQLSVLDDTILNVISSSPGEIEISKTLGEVQRPRTGMGSDLGIYTRTGGKTHKCSSCGECELKDYTGSYHISISLPYDEDGWILYDENYTCPRTNSPTNLGETPQSTWVDAHINFSNMFQWVEPLLLAVLGSADSESVFDNGTYVEGSFRTMASGWGVHGTTDVRNFGTNGTGRYSQSGFEWLLESITDPYSGLLGCEKEGMGADIRTKAPSDWEGKDNEMPPLEVGHGVELRVFDNFPSEHLPMVYRLITLLAENSRVSKTESFVYDNLSWKNTIKSSMREGWNSNVEDEYIRELETNLDIDLSGLSGNNMAFSVFEELFKVLSEKNSAGLWTGILLDDTTDLVHGNYTLTNPNRESWEIGAMNSGVTPKSIREMFNIDYKFTGELVMSDISDFEYDEDLDDLVYLAQTLGMVESIELNSDGTIYSAVFFPMSSYKGYKSPVCVL